MTELLYLGDPYKKEFEARVVDIREFQGNILVVLDKTAFYPTGGGQPCDLGKIFSNDKIYEVKEVYKYQGEVFHVVSEKGLIIGQNVKGFINWDRRYRIMRMHTAAHLISAIMGNEENVLITGNQLGLEESRIDFNLDILDRDKIQNYINKANAIIKEGRKVITYYLNREEALKIPTISRLAKGLPEGLEEIRIVEIEGIDKQADGGTHVSNISEIGEIKLVKIENKGKNNRRLYFSLIP